MPPVASTIQGCCRDKGPGKDRRRIVPSGLPYPRSGGDRVMAMSSRLTLTLIVLLAPVAAELRAQLVVGDRPTELVPLTPATRAELDRREAQKLYAQGLLNQRQDRLLEALRHFEAALKLDLESPALHRALVPLYLALGRNEDALAACRKVLDLAPEDHETWYLYSRQLKELGRTREAREALRKGVACPGLKEELDLLVQMQYELGVLWEEA